MAIPSGPGSAALTKHLRVLYGKYNTDQQMNGLQPLEWPLWLQENGYTVGPDELVVPLPDQDVDGVLRKNIYQ